VSIPAELTVILRKSLEAALVAAQGSAGFIHVCEKSSGAMRLVAQQGISDPVAETMTTVSAEDGLIAWVFRNKESLVVPNTSQDPRTVYLASSHELKVYVGVPISRGERVWGTLSVLGKSPSQFRDEDVALLGSVGEEIGIVVENALLRRKAEQLLLVQERNRLAHELHDSVTQSLYSVTLFAEAGRRLAQADENEKASEYFVQIGETGQQALKEMRLLIHRLRPSILAREGLVRALQQRLSSVEGRAGVRSQLIVEGEVKLPPTLEDALFQVAQEALNNALKHAVASKVTVHLAASDDEHVIMRVEDDGRGFDPEAAFDSGGMGLTGMRERVESLGGVLAVQSVLSQGTIVEARLIGSTKAARPRDDFDVEDLL
jgi:signal transduction histidine kinase